MPQLHHHINIAPCVQQTSAGCPSWVHRQNSGSIFAASSTSQFWCRTCRRFWRRRITCQFCQLFQCGRAMVCTQFLGFRNFIHDGIVVLQQPPPLVPCGVLSRICVTGFLEWSVPGASNCPTAPSQAIIAVVEWCSPMRIRHRTGRQDSLCRPDSHAACSSCCVCISGSRSRHGCVP